MTTEHPITPPTELVRQWAATNGTHNAAAAVRLRQRDLLLRLIAEAPVVENTNDH